ncbi:MAG TPA: 50S ribosome-binding GTPase, partial [Candidatus Sabulitectum sp.]|nr:50S ribosome-binding GTPase [Candidatus Sabulitectum sp.]
MPSGLIKSGYALLAGLTNTGKSSLLNALTETSISPTAPQPASTRMPITGICTPGNSQICFVDTPPLDGASDSSMVEWVDVVVMLLNIVTFEEDLQRPEVSGFLESAGERPLVLALGRNDYVKTEHREAYLNKARYTNRFNAAVTVNPLTGSGVKDLLNAVLASIPLRERLFPRSIKTLNSKRFLISE